MSKKTQSKDSAELIVEFSKRINMRKYLKRKTMELQSKTIKVLGNSSILKADLSVHDFQISILRKHLYKAAEIVLKKNGLTDKNIAVEEFELGSLDMLAGNTELISKSGYTYLYNINNGELVKYHTKEDKQNSVKILIDIKPVPNLGEYCHFLNIPPF